MKHKIDEYFHKSSLGIADNYNPIELLEEVNDYLYEHNYENLNEILLDTENDYKDLSENNESLLQDLNESLNLEYKSIDEYKEEIKKLIKLYSWRLVLTIVN